MTSDVSKQLSYAYQYQSQQRRLDRFEIKEGRRTNIVFFNSNPMFQQNKKTGKSREVKFVVGAAKPAYEIWDPSKEKKDPKKIVDLNKLKAPVQQPGGGSKHAVWQVNLSNSTFPDCFFL